jgi:hypothetical protein
MTMVGFALASHSKVFVIGEQKFAMEFGLGRDDFLSDFRR